MARNLVDGTNIVVESNGNNINMNLSSVYTTNLTQQINDSFKENNVYSTTETIVGTWIDGKPLYRKVYTSTNISYDAYNHIPYDNTFEIIKYDGYIVRNNKRLDRFATGTNSDSAFLVASIRSEGIEFWVDNVYQTGFEKVYFILEYTKTTD